MATRRKFARKQKFAQEDARDGKMFLIVLGIVTVALVVLLYVLFV